MFFLEEGRGQGDEIKTNPLAKSIRCFRTGRKWMPRMLQSYFEQETEGVRRSELWASRCVALMPYSTRDASRWSEERSLSRVVQWPEKEKKKSEEKKTPNKTLLHGPLLSILLRFLLGYFTGFHPSCWHSVRMGWSIETSVSRNTCPTISL